MAESFFLQNTILYVFRLCISDFRNKRFMLDEMT